MIATLTGLTIAATGVVHTVRTAVLDDAQVDDRRLRQVERDPRLATADDIESLVRAHGVREDKVWAVADRIEAAGITPRDAWTWVMKYDGTELADLCRSRLTHAEVRDHLQSLSLPLALELPETLSA